MNARGAAAQEREKRELEEKEEEYVAVVETTTIPRDEYEAFLQK